MEKLYDAEKAVPKSWDAGTDPEVAANKLNELHLPSGPLP